ncbi:hypothetical protein A0H81_04442 [Grifola frondosa]|uniref:Uncharacterized protein n=1 Tax=Grifola frondosa TaxID=5627 RepID=A0A1C7MDZ5_GRIFR|nr:hypothetical protein A0H81_04442 [Grifola frondosa]
MVAYFVDGQFPSELHAVFGAEDEANCEDMPFTERESGGTLRGRAEGRRGYWLSRIGGLRRTSSIGLDGKLRVAPRDCVSLDSHTILTVCSRSSLLQNAQRISLRARRHVSTSSRVPDSPARRNPAKKTPSRTIAASYWKNAVPRLRRMIVTT